MKLKYTLAFHFNKFTVTGLGVVALALLISMFGGIGNFILSFLFFVPAYTFAYLGGKKVGLEIKQETEDGRVNYSRTSRY